MRGINKVILIGNVGADPIIKTFQNGDKLCNISLATSEAWTDKYTGEQKSKTEWHRLVLNGKVADIANQYVKKGSRLYIEGQLRTRKYTGNDGNERQTTEVVVGITGVMQMLDGRADNGYQQQTPTDDPLAAEADATSDAETEVPF